MGAFTFPWSHILSLYILLGLIAVGLFGAVVLYRELGRGGPDDMEEDD